MDHLDPAENPWQPAALLIQPAFIRLIDQLRKRLETSDWKGSYETLEIYPDEGNDPATAAEMPQVFYWLYLERQDRRLRMNLWELCYQICFSDYHPCLDREGIADFQVGEVQTDLSLFDPEGDIDWHQLDRKAYRVVEEAFQTLSLD